MSATAICAIAFAGGLRPERELLVSEWADANRMMGKATAQPGPWRTSRVPYTREIMDNLSPSSPVVMTIFQKAAQGAGTEVLLNGIGAVCDQFTGDALILEPTIDVAKKLAKRFEDMVEATPSLRAKIAAPRSKDGQNTAIAKQYAGGTVRFGGANSAASLRSDPIRWLWMDEVDAYPDDVEGEGAAVDLAMARTGAMANRKIAAVSTPTDLATSKIHQLFLTGDQRYFHVPCPQCKTPQRLIWYAGESTPGGLRWPKGEPQKVYYECAFCAEQIPQYRRPWMNDNGVWVPSAPGVGGGKIRSYQISKLYYPFGWPEADWELLATRWEQVHKDPVRRKTFVNISLGEPYEDRNTQRADASSLMNRREAFGSGRAGDAPMPADIAVVTAGVDVQANRIEVEFVGWGADEESWSLDYLSLLGDPTKPKLWMDLDRVLQEDFESETGLRLTVSAACVDTHYQAEIATAFCADRFNRHIYAIQGRAGKLPVWPRRPGQSKYARRPVFTIGVDAAKENIYARLQIGKSGPGCCHFPISRDRDYFDQLTSEIRRLVTRTLPHRWEWKKKTDGARNEALDLRAYAYGALHARMSAGFRLNEQARMMRNMVARKIEGQGVNPPPEAPAPLIAPPPQRRVAFRMRSNV